MSKMIHHDDYYCNSDIDWFCQINGVNIHVASMGHRLPKSVESTLQEVCEHVSKIKMAPWIGKDGIWYNEELVRGVLRDADIKDVARYISTFVVMARKGFYSFAPLTTDPTDRYYYLMAKPLKPVQYEIQGLFKKSVSNVDFSQIDGQSFFSLVELLEE